MTPGPTLSLRPERDSVLLGEPVFLEMTLHNGLGEPVDVDLGHDRRSNLALTVRPPDGGAVHPPRSREAGMGLVGRETLAPGGEIRERLLLSTWYAPDAPGAYEIEVRLVAPAVTAEGRTVEVAPSPAVAVHVAPRDEAGLADTLRALAEEVLHGRDAAAGLAAADALAGVDDPAAVPFLAEVARNAGRGAVPAVAALGRLGTSHAVEALLGAADDPDLRPHALRALRTLAGREMDAGLRARVDGALEPDAD